MGKLNNLHTNIKLFIIGDGKSNFYKYKENIFYLGSMNYDLIKTFIYQSDFLIIPSYTEGLPFTLLESMNLGIPCICSNISGIKELIKDNYNGFLFDLKGYKECENELYSWKVFDSVDLYFEENVNTLVKTILKVYKISIEEYNNIIRIF